MTQMAVIMTGSCPDTHCSPLALDGRVIVTMILGRRLEGSGKAWTRTNRKSYNRSFPCPNYRPPSSSDNVRSSGTRRPPPFLNDDGDDEVPMSAADKGQHDRSSLASASSSVPAPAPVAATAENFFRQPTAFAAPIPNTTTLGSSGPTFYQHKDKTKTPISGSGSGHPTPTAPAMSESADATGTGSTSILQFCVEGT
ncbi:hypothetical protein BGY98DRAFT_705933 [Russula aff. rugulosa BPL654]|nr:hypothetical protein BGY98DRAFT_705933 [Russula aff. rugulosa BPL654]